MTDEFLHFAVARRPGSVSIYYMNNVAKSEALEIAAAYEGMLRPLVEQGRPLPAHLVERRQYWLAVAAAAQCAGATC